MTNPFESPTLIGMRVVLLDVEPEVWRQIEVDAETRLDEFHRILQVSIGWQETHLHAFSEREPGPRRPGEDGRSRRWLPPFSIDEGLEGLPETPVGLGEVLTHTSGPLFYEYDFGDGWVHRIEFIEYLPGEPDGARARVTGGARACPPEDCGGTWGYAELLEKLAHPMPEVRLPAESWASGIKGPWRSFDPDRFEPEAASSELLARFGRLAATEVRLSAIEALIERLAPGYRVEFRAHLNDCGVFDPVESQAEEIVRPYRWLLDRVGPDGLKLTAAGWLPPKVVNDAMHELGWAEDWYGAMNREIETAPVASLRQSAQDLGLLRKYKGTLKLSKQAEEVIDDPIALFRLITQRLPGTQEEEWLTDAALLIAAEVCGGEHRDTDGYLTPVADGLNLLGWSFTAEPIQPEDLRYDLGDIWRDLSRLGAFEDGSRPYSYGPPRPQGSLIARAILQSLGP